MAREYNKTSYLKYLDFLMIGTYYKTAKEGESLYHFRQYIDMW